MQMGHKIGRFGNATAFTRELRFAASEFCGSAGGNLALKSIIASMRPFGYHLHPKRLNCWGNALSVGPTSNPFQNNTLAPGPWACR